MTDHSTPENKENHRQSMAAPYIHPLPDLIEGRLIKRYKRFLADVTLEDQKVTAHCPNSGSMKACLLEGAAVYLSTSDNPKRKLRHTLEFIKMPTSLVGINTLLPNRLIARSIEKGAIPELTAYNEVKREVKINERSRIDLRLSGKNRPLCYVEIKNCTMVTDGIAAFPDAVTGRGQKHLMELMTLKAKGHRAVLFFLIQRMDATVFRPADEIDPEYGRLLREAVKSGVEILIYDTLITPQTIQIHKLVPMTL